MSLEGGPPPSRERLVSALVRLLEWRAELIRRDAFPPPVPERYRRSRTRSRKPREGGPFCSS